MGLLRTLIARPVMTTMLVVVMVVMGLYSYSHLVTELIPSMNFPVIVVTTAYPGAAPGEVETQVTKKIEDAVATLADIDKLTSTSMQSMSQVVVQFEMETDEDQDAIDVKDKVDAILGDLPEDAEDPIITTPSSPSTTSPARPWSSSRCRVPAPCARSTRWWTSR